VRVANTGERAGARSCSSTLAPGQRGGAPARWLAGFALVSAAPGQEVVADIAVPQRAFEHWDAGAHRFATEPGTFVLEAGPLGRRPAAARRAQRALSQRSVSGSALRP
jgi:beta-glucosidase